MRDFLSSDAGLLLTGLFFAFYWVPFALGAYLVERWDRERTRQAVRRLVRRIRHIAPDRPATPKPA